LNDFVFDSSSNSHSEAQHVVDAEDLGVDMVWSTEAWATDVVVPLAFEAAPTSEIKIVAGIPQISARTPVTTVMTAKTLDHVSNGRPILDSE
jgi:alkanesulfonate monooxygenase SsuD/methylene tetrahydromethanopterin reductase-like flavin-dependent oxidoreductase (luciferase family)